METFAMDMVGSDAVTDNIRDIVIKAHELKASDIHMVCGLPVKIRIDGSLQNLGETVLDDGKCNAFAEELAGEMFEKCRVKGEIDLACTIEGLRLRVNIFRQQGHTSLSLRILSDYIPEIEELGLPKVVEEFPKYKTGIVLVTGETGSGKSTTLASVINRINHTRCDHIITLEDPIEYAYTPDKCAINQREIGTDTDSYESGLRSILREDPNVILIGEMRDLNTISAALTAAETGHLVFATLHTNSAADSIDRMVNAFPDIVQKQIRLQLSTTLRAVMSQQLIPRIGGGRVAACEVMVVNSAKKNLIREGKTPQIDSFITMGAQEGSITMDNALLKLVNSMAISRETAAEYARDRDAFARRR